MFEEKNVLVAGGSGLIGRQLINLLLLEKANVFVADKRKPGDGFSEKVTFNEVDLTDYNNCLSVCANMDYVFNLMCVKGSPKAMKERPVDHFDTMLLFNTNLLRAAHKSNVKRYLYTSSIAVYHPTDIFYEDDVWSTFPSENDKFAGWVKRMGELQTQAYKIQYDWNNISIVRPANTYGPYDDFNSDGAMVIPSLIKKVVANKDKLIVWGDGSNIRDFIHCKDVARGMMMVMKESPGPLFPVNLGSGVGYSIKELVNIILKNINEKPEIIWDTNKITGDKKRVLDTNRAESLGFKPEIGLEKGIGDLVSWYIENETKN